MQPSYPLNMQKPSPSYTLELVQNQGYNGSNRQNSNAGGFALALSQAGDKGSVYQNDRAVSNCTYGQGFQARDWETGNQIRFPNNQMPVLYMKTSDNKEIPVKLVPS